jgi:hypothetical protein
MTTQGKTHGILDQASDALGGLLNFLGQLLG